MNANSLNQLIDRFLDEKQFARDDAIELLGEPEKEEGRIVKLTPSDEGLSVVRLYEEDLKAGDGLLTTIELELQPVWEVDRRRLIDELGKNERRLPRTDPGRPVRLRLEREGKAFRGSVTLTIADRPTENPDDVIVTKILIRRLFPEPKEADSTRGTEDASRP